MKQSDPDSPSGSVFEDGIQHLRAELELVRLLLDDYLSRQEQLRPDAEQLGGFAVGREELVRFLDGSDAPEAADNRGAIDAARTQLDRRVAASRAAGMELPVLRLADSFHLSPLELQLLMVLVAPEIDLAFERAYSYAWNDFSRKRPDIGFALEMVLPTLRERLEGVLALAATESLRRNGLVEVTDTGGQAKTHGFMSRPLRVAPRIVSHLLGDHAVDELIAPFARLSGRGGRDAITLQEEALEVIWPAINAALDIGGERRIGLRGPRGAGKKTMVEAIATERNKTALFLDMWSVSGRSERLAAHLRAAKREASLRGAYLYLDFNGLERPEDIGTEQRLAIEHALSEYFSPVFFGFPFRVRLFETGRGRLVDVPVPLPDVAARVALWRRAIPRSARRTVEPSLELVARRFPLSGGGIVRAGRHALDRARTRSLKHPVVSPDDLLVAARGELVGRLAHLATRIESAFGWDDLIVPPPSLEAMLELTRFAKHRKQVFEEWGFAAKVPYGRGLSALFHGPPGTGKTMAASVIATELGMDLFRVDLSRIVSKYVGETEKNLARVFDEASQSRSILLFDEADSLFARRTDVKSATDRYANLEVNYLLTRMEEYEGVTILTTNFEQAIDQAFKRRLRFRIHFVFPDADARTELWRRMIPGDAQIEPNVDWRTLGEELELSGGNIKNAVLRAAFTAAERGDVIRYGDLMGAGIKECKETGKLVRDGGTEEPDL